MIAAARRAPRRPASSPACAERQASARSRTAATRSGARRRAGASGWPAGAAAGLRLRGCGVRSRHHVRHLLVARGASGEAVAGRATAADRPGLRSRARLERLAVAWNPEVPNAAHAQQLAGDGHSATTAHGAMRAAAAMIAVKPPTRAAHCHRRHVLGSRSHMASASPTVPARAPLGAPCRGVVGQPRRAASRAVRANRSGSPCGPRRGR